MKQYLCTFLLAVFISACASPKNIDNITYDTYGLLNADDKKNPNIRYEVCWGNVIWGVLLIETIVAPIYFFGFALFEPAGKKTEVKGQV